MRGQWPHACFTVSVTFIFMVFLSLSAVQAM
ncbi:putative membrane protein [Klebsiella pneumoniae VA360]|nr:putative membrane protein [Klebsiella pneumoniae VA360]